MLSKFIWWHIFTDLPIFISLILSSNRPQRKVQPLPTPPPIQFPIVIQLRPRERESRWTLITIRAHSPDPESHVILTHLHCRRIDLAHRNDIRPLRRIRRSPQNLIARKTRLIALGPAKLALVAQNRRIDRHLLRRARCLRQAPHGRGIDLADPSDKLVVDELRQIAELDPVDDLDVLVLVREVLLRLREARGGVAGGEKGFVVAAAEVAVGAVDDGDVHLREPVDCDAGDKAG